MLQPEEVLSKYWGFKNFRPLQKDIVLSVVNGKDTLALLPTGGGKSICFQVPGLMLKGVCLVISPLIALMNDQVGNLLKRGIKATAITSGMDRKEIDIALDNCIYGDVKFLYVSPERLSSELFLARLERMKIGMIAVDEAHCISQWGYDFRPSYLRIAELREHLPQTPVLALTATATPEVVEDIQERLQFQQKNVFRKSFSRPNLAYLVFHEENKYGRLLNICAKVKGSGIVYVRNRRRTHEIASFLHQNGVTASYYHAGLTFEQRSERQQAWLDNQIRVMVCTNAFGMGIDKPDVTFVVHIDLPDSPEAYFQEAGRAGRNEEKAYATILWDETDLDDLKANIERSFPPVDTIKNIYQALGNYLKLALGSGEGQSFKLDINDFSKNFNLDPTEVYASLKFLERDGLLAVSENAAEASKIFFVISYEDLYSFQVFNKELDSLIKAILRTYPGAFTVPVKIRETELAKQLNTSQEQVIKKLELLVKKNVISYFPKTDLPVVTYLTGRIDRSKVRISHEHYHERKAIAEKRSRAMFEYVTDKTECRSRILLHYFGENTEQRCGICDTCLALKKSERSPDIKKLRDQVHSALSKKPLSYIEISELFPEGERQTVISVIRLMLDEGSLNLGEDQRLYLK